MFRVGFLEMLQIGLGHVSDFFLGLSGVVMAGLVYFSPGAFGILSRNIIVPISRFVPGTFSVFFAFFFGLGMCLIFFWESFESFLPMFRICSRNLVDLVWKCFVFFLDMSR